MDNPDHEEFRKLRAKLVKLVRESKTSCDAVMRRYAARTGSTAVKKGLVRPVAGSVPPGLSSY